MQYLNEKVKKSKFASALVLSLHRHLSRLSVVDFDSEVGEYTYLAGGVRVTKSKIGPYCSIGPGELIGIGDHD